MSSVSREWPLCVFWFLTSAFLLFFSLKHLPQSLSSDRIVKTPSVCPPPGHLLYYSLSRERLQSSAACSSCHCSLSVLWDACLDPPHPPAPRPTLPPPMASTFWIDLVCKRVDSPRLLPSPLPFRWLLLSTHHLWPHTHTHTHRVYDHLRRSSRAVWVFTVSGALSYYNHHHLHPGEIPLLQSIKWLEFVTHTAQSSAGVKSRAQPLGFVQRAFDVCTVLGVANTILTWTRHCLSLCQVFFLPVMELLFRQFFALTKLPNKHVNT